MTPNALHLPTQYFDEDAVRFARAETQSPKSRSTLIIMRPSTFLAMAAEGVAVDKTKTVDDLIKSGTRFNTFPYLMFKNNGDGTAQVIGHEGRHRCRALRKLGDKPVPVVFVSQEGGRGPAIRWGSQREASDRVPRWPRVLINEDRTDQIAFPESILYKHERVEAKEKILKSWTAKDKLTELHLVKDEYGYIIQDVKKSPLDKQGPGVRGQSFLNKIKSDGEAIAEFTRRVKEITTPKGLSIKKRKVARIMAEEQTIDAKLAVFAKKTAKPNKRLKRAIKGRKTHKQISRQLKSQGNKLLQMEAKLKDKLAEIHKELKKLDVHKEKHRQRILRHIDKIGVARQGLKK